jgi:NADH-quinone oxidoreductase subunit J
VYSVIFLVLNFFATAVVFLMLGAEFLAAVQILVYAGAIMVLFLFVVMLLNLRRVDPWRGGFVAFLGYALAAGVGFQLVWMLARRMIVKTPVETAPPVGSIHVVGNLLYTKYLFLFEATSVLLFIAVIGGVVLAKQVHAARRADGGGRA